MASSFDLERTPVHLGLDPRIQVEDAFTGDMAWYERYGARHADDGDTGRLVSLHTFTCDWDSWEMHPHGEELVVCLSGRLELVQEIDGVPRPVVLQPGMAVINPAGVWHSANVTAPCRALFITSGRGTEVRPR
jgi:mannose-6-phosphate isomerase-like protein (cupin superfamily)